MDSASPDKQGWTIWETLANTIDSDDLNLYLILDEAHRGFNTKTTSDKPTIVRRLVNGTRSRPPIPIVWGISATIAHFENAMKDAEATKNRRALPSIMVDPIRVQDSGLVKDTLLLDIPNESGNFDSVLVRRAAKKLKDSSIRWGRYLQSQGRSDKVNPLLILQTPNTPNPDDIGVALDVIFDEYKDLKEESVRHVLGDHTKQEFGRWQVDWIEPQRVQDESHVRVIIAKDAISTGWDCPRAEVLVSFRTAKDHTHITQLLGRMVRNPLAQRIPGDERLNSVDCILPFFDRSAAVKVVRFLTGDLDSIPGAEKKAVIDGKELLPNPNIPKGVWDLWEKLPSQTLPRKGARPVKRLIALAQALSADEIAPGSVRVVTSEMHTILDANIVRYSDKLDDAIREVWGVEIQQIEGKFGKSNLKFTEFVERADERSIRSGFEVAKKAFGADIAQSYVNHLAGSDESGDEELKDAFVSASALATIKEIRDKVDQEALDMTNQLFNKNRVAIKELPDFRQQQYEEIRAMATEPQITNLNPPRTRIEGFSFEEDGEIKKSDVAPLHLMSDEEGNFPLSSLNNWERKILNTELNRKNVVGWYRNPSRAAVDSIGIAYRDDNTANWRSMHPDFIFFHEIDGEIKASILDPHGHHLEDAAMKLKALAKFAESYGSHFHRIEAFAESGGKMKLFDLQDESVRNWILSVDDSASDMYVSDNAVEYDSSS